MANPALQTADTQTGSGASASSHTLTYPTNLASGNLILVMVTRGTLTRTPSATGFTLILASGQLCVLAKSSDGTETGTFTLSWTGATTAEWRLDRVTGWYGGTINSGAGSNTSDGIEAVAALAASTTTPDPPSVTPAWGSADDLIFAVLCNGGASPTTTGYPSGYGNTVETHAVNTVARATKNVTASSEDPGTFTMSGASTSTAAVATIALRPAGAAAHPRSFVVVVG